MTSGRIESGPMNSTSWISWQRSCAARRSPTVRDPCRTAPRILLCASIPARKPQYPCPITLIAAPRGPSPTSHAALSSRSRASVLHGYPASASPASIAARKAISVISAADDAFPGDMLASLHGDPWLNPFPTERIPQALNFVAGASGSTSPCTPSGGGAGASLGFRPGERTPLAAAQCLLHYRCCPIVKGKPW